jgi:hypothetical protein
MYTPRSQNKAAEQERNQKETPLYEPAENQAADRQPAP